MSVILVAGTHGWQPGEWNTPGSPFVEFLRSNGVSLEFGETRGEEPRPFVWDGNLGGIGFGNGDLRGWHASGLNLYNYIVPPRCPDRRIPPAQTRLIMHSHGGNVGIFACAAGLLVDTFITIGTPVRKDMKPYVEAARKNIRYWLHIYSDHTDRWQWFGELFDGHIGIVRDFATADRNDQIPGVGHAGILRNSEHFHFWIDRGWIDSLRNV